MAGGTPQAHDLASPLLEAMAATVRDQRCICRLETAAAAHFVKMVHAGVEYALLQLLAETFDLLRRTLLLTDEELHDASGACHVGVLNGYLMEISGRVFEPVDKQTPRLLLLEKLASARSDALGKWIVQSARELEVLIPTIQAAVEPEHAGTTERRQALAAAPFRQPVGHFGGDPQSVLDGLHAALHAAMIIAYAQGMALLIAGSNHLGFQFQLHEISRAWRGCTHLRTTLLDDITSALEATPDLPGLLCDDDLSQAVMDCQEHLRHAVWRAHQMDALVPALLASLDYLDSNRAAWMPINLIQVPRYKPSGAVQFRSRQETTFTV
jgi:6-phosphogluconate dehydrogenase